MVGIIRPLYPAFPIIVMIHTGFYGLSDIGAGSLDVNNLAV
jgi:hypothetical protein